MSPGLAAEIRETSRLDSIPKRQARRVGLWEAEGTTTKRERKRRRCHAVAMENSRSSQGWRYRFVSDLYSWPRYDVVSNVRRRSRRRARVSSSSPARPRSSDCIFPPFLSCPRGFPRLPTSYRSVVFSDSRQKWMHQQPNWPPRTPSRKPELWSYVLLPSLFLFLTSLLIAFVCNCLISLIHMESLCQISISVRASRFLGKEEGKRLPTLSLSLP